MSTLMKTEPLTSASLARLFRYHDRQFIELAYQLILRRDADEAGLENHLEALRLGESRKEIAYRIATSEEAQSKRVDVGVFKSYQRWRKLERIPVIGALFLVVLCLTRIRHIVREFRRLQNSAYGGLHPGLARDKP